MRNCAACERSSKRPMPAWWKKPSNPVATRKSDKYWVTDPTGIAWETFHTLGSIPVYGEDTAVFDHGESIVPVEVRRPTAAFPLRKRSAGRLLRKMNGQFDLTTSFSLHRQLGAQYLRRVALNALGHGKFRAFSAGSHPKGQVHPWP